VGEEGIRMYESRRLHPTGAMFRIRVLVETTGLGYS